MYMEIYQRRQNNLNEWHDFLLPAVSCSGQERRTMKRGLFIDRVNKRY